MKALEILNKQRNNLLEILDSNWDSNAFETLQEIEQSIAELEGLQAPKTCDGCSFEDYPNRFNTLNTCRACFRSGITDYYEPKGIL